MIFDGCGGLAQPAHRLGGLSEKPRVINLAKLLRKYHEDELFRRLATGSPTWSETVAEAVMKDRTGEDYRMSAHSAASIDLVAENGNHVQVKTVGTIGSFAGIRRGRDTAIEIMVIATLALHHAISSC